MGFLDRFRIPTPRPSLTPAEESIEAAMSRLRTSTLRLEGMLIAMRAAEVAEARRAHTEQHAASTAHEKQQQGHANG